VGGAFLSSSTKQVQKGKEKMVEIEMKKQEEDPHETKQDFDLVDFDEEDENENTRMIFKEKEALIGEFQVNLQR